MDGGGTSFRHLGLRRGESLRFRVRGDCMPELPNESSVTVRKRLFYLPGDILVVRRSDHWNVHRFVGYALGRRGWVALTHADSGTAADAAAHIDRIEGAVAGPVPLRERSKAVRRYLSTLLQRLRRSA